MVCHVIEHVLELATKKEGDPHAMIMAICIYILEKEGAIAPSNSAADEQLSDGFPTDETDNVGISVGTGCNTGDRFGFGFGFRLDVAA